MLGKMFIESLARVRVEVAIASEYRYSNPISSNGTLVIAISQSGETADTLAGLRLAKMNGSSVISLVNVMSSTIARESHGVMPLMAGPEIGVASTKAYTAQVVALYLFAIQLAKAKNTINQESEQNIITAINTLPELLANTLQLTKNSVKETAELFSAANSTAFLGRQGEHVTALEGSLKLKEIAYINSFGYASGEFKHGPIALVTNQLPIICMCVHGTMYDKMISNIQEVYARKGRIIIVTDKTDKTIDQLSDNIFPVLKTSEELLQPVLSILPLQLYAYYVATNRKCDVDQPRNLAKSVTVE